MKLQLLILATLLALCLGMTVTGASFNATSSVSCTLPFTLPCTL